MPKDQPRKKHVPFSPTKRRTAQYRRSQGDQQKAIAIDLGVSEASVSRNLAQLGKSTDYHQKTPRSGRPTVLDKHTRLRLKKGILSREFPDATAAQMAICPDVSPQTVRRHLTYMGLPGRRHCKVHALNKIQAGKRLAWALEHRHWTVEMWKTVLFSDEARKNKKGLDGLTWCRRGPNEAFDPDLVQDMFPYGGGGIMVWGVITWNGVGRLHRVEGKISARVYTAYLTEALLPTIDSLNVPRDSIIFQQDGAKVHTAKWTMRWFADQDLNVLPWPPSSPDMSIIENLWAILKKKAKLRLPWTNSGDELWEVLQDEWYKIDTETVNHLYESMPRRIEELIKAKGWYTPY